VARVFREILRDEMEHKDTGARALARVVKTETAFRRAARIIREVSSQRLRMRNEQFDFPMSEKELQDVEGDWDDEEEISEGEVSEAEEDRESSGDEEEEKRPAKKVRMRSQR